MFWVAGGAVCLWVAFGRAIKQHGINDSLTEQNCSVSESISCDTRRSYVWPSRFYIVFSSIIEKT